MADPWALIIPEACELKRSSPEQYDRFLHALQTYAGQLVTQFVAADKDKLELAQGRCQVVLELTERLRECFALELKYRKRT